MSSSSAERRIYRFSTFEVDAQAGEVRKQGIRIRVQDQPLKLLIALLERPGELLTREELHQRLWSDEIFVDFEHGLNAAVTRLRQALNDSAQTPRFIESLPRRGYRFIGEVRSGTAHPPATMGTETLPFSPEQRASARTVIDNKRLTPWIAASMFLTAAIVISVVHFRQRPKEDQQVKFTLLPPEGTKFAEFDTVAASPDGRLLAFTATNQSGENQLWVRPMDAVTSRRLDGTDGASFPFWSADTRSIGFFASGKLKKIDAYGGPPSPICDAPSGRGGSWNREGEIVFAPSPRSPLFRVSSAGGEPKPVTSLDRPRGETSHRWPRFLPDGRHFVYAVQSSKRENFQIYTGMADSGRVTLLLSGQSNAEYTSILGHGYLLFARGRTLMSQPFDANRLALGGEASPIAENITSPQYIEPMYAKFSVSDNGVLVYESVRSTDQLTWFDQNGKQLATIGEAGTHLIPSLSPDDKELTFDQIDSRTGTFDIWRFDNARGPMSHMTFDKHNEVDPVWSPDGSWIAFSSDRQGAFDLYEKSSQPGGNEKLLLKSGQWKFVTDWSPDGRSLLYYEINEDRNRDVWALSMGNAGKPVPLVHTEANEADAVFSPDGKWFAYSSDQSGKQEVYVQAFPPAAGGGTWLMSSGGGSHPKWPRDARQLFYLAPDHTIMAADVSLAGGFHAGVPRPLFHAEMVADFRSGFAVAANGRRFLIPVALSRTSSPTITVAVNWMSGLQK